jgi:hypothetical protein
MLAIGIPVYVCATASTPLAVGLIAGGVSPGAALVFLLVGPATNIASLVVLSSQFGKRVLAGYLVSIAVVSVAMGVLLDAFIGPGFRQNLVDTRPMLHGDVSTVGIVSTVILLVLAFGSIYRTRPHRRWIASFKRLFKMA